MYMHHMTKIINMMYDFAIPMHLAELRKLNKGLLGSCLVVHNYWRNKRAMGGEAWKSQATRYDKRQSIKHKKGINKPNNNKYKRKRKK